MIPFHRVELTDSEVDAVVEVLRSGWLTSGSACADLEAWLSSHLGGQALTLSSCTAALEIAMRALGVGAGDEVITTSLTFVATSAAIAKAGGVPVWVDVDPDTGLIDPDAIAAAVGPRTVGILTVDYAGARVDHRAIRDIADRHGLFFVSDAAHSLGSATGDRSALGLADAACLSFYATKNLTGGEGGALVTRSQSLAEQARVLRLHGMSADASERYRGGTPHYDVTALGEKANLSDLAAALVRAQANRLTELENARRGIAARYLEGLKGVPGVRLPNYDDACVWHLFPIRVPADRRAMMVEHLAARGVSVSIHFRPVHSFTYWANHYTPRHSLSATSAWGVTELSLPIFPSMTPREVDTVIDAVAKVAGHS